MKHLERKDNEAYAILKNLRVSPTKANIVLETIRGKKASEAINLLKFSERGIAKDVCKVLNSAVANAENNHQLDVDKFYVYEASVGKGLVLKRFKARAKGRSVRILKPYSNLTIKLKEQVETQIEKKNKIIKKDKKKKINEEKK